MGQGISPTVSAIPIPIGSIFNIFTYMLVDFNGFHVGEYTLNIPCMEIDGILIVI